MFRSNIVLCSGAGGVPTVKTDVPTVVESAGPGTAALPAAKPGDGGAAPDPAARPAPARILEAMNAAGNGPPALAGLGALQDYARHGDTGARQIAENLRAATMTKESLIEEMKSGAWLAQGDRAGRPANAAMVAALANGTARVLDLEEIGLASKGIYTAHFTSDGEFAGVSAEIEADFEAIARFQDNTFIRHADGSMTDRATGRHANFVQDGHKFLYVTWP